ncbi:MAG: zinc ribbon domain-containing protein [Dehalococcoidia bacterium]|nr:zinc ribbon domain-containing protein [Dehalococcoidia bacterium]
MAGAENIPGPCTRCGETLEPGAFFCGNCGTGVTATPGDGRVTLQFMGTTSQAYVWVTWLILLSLVIVPTGWGVASLSRWYVRNVWFSDGTQAWFEGTGGQIWWYFVVQGIVSILGRLYPVLVLVSIFIDPWVNLVVLRWFAQHSRLSSGERTEFTGTYWPLLGLSVLLVLSIFTIIGWAWVLSRLMGWICQNLNIGPRQGVFVGNGLGFLWRGIAMILASLPIVTIPWAWLWFTKWLTRCVVFQDRSATVVHG